MKKLLAVVLMLLMCTPVYAGGWIPGRCGTECPMLSYQVCVQKFKVLNTVPGPDGNLYYTVNPTTPEFKACEVTETALCRASRGCK